MMSPRTLRRVARAAAPVTGLLAAGLLIWSGSTAAFTASSNNTSDSWSTGQLALQNNGGGATFATTTAALFSETGIKPGVSGTKCITVESTGSLAGALKLYRGALSGTNAANLAAVVTFSVDATPVSASTNITAGCTSWPGGTSGAVYNGLLTGFPTTYGGASGAAALTGGTERVAYRIAWALPVSVVDNTLQGSSVSTDLTWEVQ
jgi:hypothetical protein